MNLTLTITASPTVIARVAAMLESEGNETTTSIAQSGPVSSPSPIAPMPSASAPAGAADDDDGVPAANAPAADSSGIPWDGRIHSKSKATNADGTWRKKRGVSDEEVNYVEAELRNAQAPQQPAPMPPMQQQMPAAPMQMPAMPVPTAQPMQQMPVVHAQMPAMPSPTGVAEAPAPAAPQPANVNFFDLMQAVQRGMQTPNQAGAPTVDAEYLATVAQRAGQAFQVPIVAITDFSVHPRGAEMSNWAAQLMQNEGRWING